MPNNIRPVPSVLHSPHKTKTPRITTRGKIKNEPMKITIQSSLSFQPTYQLHQPIQ
jgi:hypothetical protein